ncbi:DUF3426 domain-containing protein [Limnohabitans sp. 2KL-17]|uniref:DUF3426 domain-containing protein n=1 Tax=Limnohabitans sp. 2KL-17 TaxID=1100704 RepID=UPI0018EEA2D4|nr:DUF3426 domain-containing protein [Limnohabitans sp. 2KL-17]
MAWPEAVHGLPGEIVAEVAVERLIVDELLKQEDRSSDVQTVSAVASFEDALSTFKPLSPLPLERGADQTDTSQPQRSKSGSWASKWFAAVLLFTLAFQWLWMERQTLVEKNPHVAKILHVVCRVLACEILPLQVRDGVVIENSSLMPQGDGFLLSWSVRNATSHQLQMPALELTLLNAQDKTLVRRVFSVSELEAPAALAQGEILEGKLQVMPEAGLSPSGYRLLSFYP